jgi:hypothetical protein
MTRTTRRVAETGVSMAIGPEGGIDAVIRLNAKRITSILLAVYRRGRHRFVCCLECMTGLSGDARGVSTTGELKHPRATGDVFHQIDGKQHVNIILGR